MNEIDVVKMLTEIELTDEQKQKINDALFNRILEGIKHMDVEQALYDDLVSAMEFSSLWEEVAQDQRVTDAIVARILTGIKGK